LRVEEANFHSPTTFAFLVQLFEVHQVVYVSGTFRKLVVKGLANLTALLTRKLPGLSSVIQDPEVVKLQERLPIETVQELKKFNKELASKALFQRLVSLKSSCAQKEKHNIFAGNRNNFVFTCRYCSCPSSGKVT